MSQNAIFDRIYGDPRHHQVVEKLIEQTRAGRMLWTKSPSSYETVLQNGTKVVFILGSHPLPFLKTEENWAQFSVRQRDGNEVMKVANPAGISLTMPPPPGTTSRETLQQTIDKLFNLVTNKGKDDLDSILDEIDRTPKWENAANLFWLGNDLRWTMQELQVGAPKERILHGLTQSRHHSSELGLAESTPGKQLSELRSKVESLPESTWKTDLSQQIISIMNGFATLAKEHQPNFRPNP